MLRNVDLAAAVVERFPVAAVVIDAGRTIHLANTAARENLSARDPFLEHDQKLLLCCPVADANFEVVLANDFARGDRGAILSVREGSASGTWIVKIDPLQCGVLSNTLTLISWFDPAECIPLDRPLIERVYGLSPAESKLAVLLASGSDLGSIAAQIGIQPQTAKSHLKSIFRKMEVSRQQTLVRVLSRLAAVTK